MHGSLVLKCDVMEYSSLFREIADAYFEHELYEPALATYEELAGRGEVSSAP